MHRPKTRKARAARYAVAAALTWAGVSTGTAAADPVEGLTISSSGPVLKYGVARDLGCEALYQEDRHGEFYGDTACGTLLATSRGLWAPNYLPAAHSLNPKTRVYEGVSQVSSGEGTVASPRTVTTVVKADEVFTLTQVDTYVPGQSRVTTSITLTNGGSATESVSLFRAGDCYASDSDTGYGQMGVQSAACVSGRQARTVRFFVPSGIDQPGARTYEGRYSELWDRIGTYLPGNTPQPFNGECRCDQDIDNAAGLQWQLSLAPGQAVTITSAIDFGPVALAGGLAPTTRDPYKDRPYPAGGGKRYVALGDSYSSGEGAGTPGQQAHHAYLPGSDTPSNTCHRSPYAYPRVLAGKLWVPPGTTRTNVDEVLDFRACSGAVVADLTSPNRGDRREGEGPQVNAVGPNTDLVTISMGGNDADFTGIVTKCVVPLPRPTFNVWGMGTVSTYVRTQECSDAAKKADQAIAALGAFTGDRSLTQAYAAIIERLPAQARLAVLGYPDFAPYTSVLCRTSWSFSDEESRWLSNRIRSANTLIMQRATWVGATFVDIDRLYQPPNAPSHRICSGEEWVNGLVFAPGVSVSLNPSVRWTVGGPVVLLDPALHDLNPVAVESFHPNMLGQRAAANAVYRRVVNGESNDDLSRDPGKSALARRIHQAQTDPVVVSPALPQSIVVRQGEASTFTAGVEAGATTVLSLSYDGGAAPEFSITGPDGSALPLTPISDGSGIARVQGASIARLGPVSAIELRGLPAGNYAVSASLPATAPTAAGVLAIRTTRVTEVNLPPSMPFSAQVNRAGRLTASVEGAADPEGLPIAVRWDFGDGGTSPTASVAHRYAKRGRYTAKVTVTDSAGAAATGDAVVDTRTQGPAAMRVTRTKKGAKVRVTCRADAVGQCSIAVAVTRTPRGGRAVTRPSALALSPGQTTNAVVALPGTRRRPFAGSVTVRMGARDAAVRPSPTRVTKRLVWKARRSR